MRLTLYGKPGCHLCEEAARLLAELAAEFDWDVTERDITADPALEERFRYLIPVVEVDNAVLVYPPITAERLLESMAEVRR
ncbi:MAG: glutaredoxin family protein [Caldilineales bacterium]|nr:glutaredoxin family protein [Caldilineales bacterium]